MAKGFGLMTLGLVGYKLDAGVNTRADVTLRDVAIVRDETRDGVQMTSRTGSARRIWEIWRKLRVLKLDTKRDGRLSLARRSQANLRAMGAARDRGQMIKTE